MKACSIPTALLGLAATAVEAQEYSQTGPFSLTIVDSANATLNGYGLSACHAGAALEGLCLGGPAGASSSFYHNLSAYNQPDYAYGPLVWNLPIGGGGTVQNISSGMQLSYPPNSNVAVPLFYPGGQTATSVGFANDTGKMSLPPSFDDSAFAPGLYPNWTTSGPLYHWHLCYAIVGTYYYHALAWVTAGAPSNPTCQAVNVTRTFL